MTPRSIVQLCRGHAWSGGESVVLNLAVGLRDRGYASTVVTFSDGPLAAQLERAGVRTISIGVASSSDPRAVWRLRSVLRQVVPDVVHTHGPSPMVLGAIAARLAGVPIVVTTFHHMAGVRSTDQRLRLTYARLENLAARYWTDACVGFAPAVREDAIRVRGIPASRVTAIHNGIDLRRFATVDAAARGRIRRQLGLADTARVVGAVGRLITIKGHATLIRAFARIRDAVADARLVIVGDGPERGSLARLARSLSVASEVTFAGPLVAGAELYAAMDAFVYPSVGGVFGLVVMEAMASGVAVVASGLPGSDALLQDGVNALVTPPGDADAITAAVVRLLRDEDLAARLAQAGHATVTGGFGSDAMVDRYADLYRAAARREPLPAAMA